MKRIRLWVGLGISVVCLALALRGVDFEGLGQALQSVRWPYLVLAFSALLLAVWLRAVRWRVLFYPQTGLSLSTLFSIINIGYLFINVLPVRVGELVRAYLAGELLGTGTPRAFSTIVLERTLDVLTIVLLLLGLAPFTPLPLWAVRAGLIAGAGAVVMIVVMIVVALNPERGVRMGGWLARWLPERFRGTFTAAWASLLDGFTVVKEPGQLLRVVLLSVAIWAGSAMINYWVLVGFTLPAPPTAALLVLCITVLGMVIPSSPGYIGVFEYLVVLTLSLFAIDRDLALSYGLVLHGVNYVGRYNKSLKRDELLNGVRVVRTWAMLRISRGMIMPAFPLAAWRLIREHDVVSIHSPLLEASLVTTIARFSRKPVVITHHGDLVLPKGWVNRFIESVVFRIYCAAAKSAARITAYSQDYAEHSHWLSRFLGKVRVIYPPIVVATPKPGGPVQRLSLLPRTGNGRSGNGVFLLHVRRSGTAQRDGVFRARAGGIHAIRHARGGYRYPRRT